MASRRFLTQQKILCYLTQLPFYITTFHFYTFVITVILGNQKVLFTEIHTLF